MEVIGVDPRERRQPSARGRRDADSRPVAWQRLAIAGWIGAFLGFLAVAVSSRTIGKPPWWLGTYGNPASKFESLVPAGLILVALLTAAWAPRRTAVVGSICAVGLGLVATFDVASAPGTALVEGVIALAMVLVSIAHRLAVGAASTSSPDDRPTEVQSRS